jgi:hypothetical protein
MKRILVWMVLPLVFGLAFPVVGQDDQSSTVTRILTIRALWGQDFPAALSSLPYWSRVGERTVVVFHDRIIGATPFRTAEAAQPARITLSEQLSQSAPSPAPAFIDLLSGVTGRPSPFRSDVVRGSDDGSYRVAIVGPSPQFLPPGLTVEMVESLIGPAQAVTSQVIQTEGERRPVILTLHSYAGGAVIFAESDFAPKPGLIDRSILNVPDVSAVAFKSQ